MIYRPGEGHESAIFNKLTELTSFLELNLRISMMTASHIYFYPSTCHIVTTTILLKTCDVFITTSVLTT